MNEYTVNSVIHVNPVADVPTVTYWKSENIIFSSFQKLSSKWGIDIDIFILGNLLIALMWYTKLRLKNLNISVNDTDQLEFYI